MALTPWPESSVGQGQEWGCVRGIHAPNWLPGSSLRRQVNRWLRYCQLLSVRQCAPFRSEHLYRTLASKTVGHNNRSCIALISVILVRFPSASKALFNFSWVICRSSRYAIPFYALMCVKQPMSIIDCLGYPVKQKQCVPSIKLLYPLKP